MTPSVGIIANPASGKDIRRLVAHGSVFDNNEKVNIIERVLLGLDALGIEQVLAMPDISGLVRQARDRAKVDLAVQLLDIIPQNNAQDSTKAAQLMTQAGVGCIVTLGGDGTNRAVAKGCGYVPLVPISTGTNNAFPVMVEGTLAGLAAAVVAQRVPGVREAGIRLARRLDVFRNGELIDFALVDVVVYAERFVASGAIWDSQKIRTVVLSEPHPGTIGASAIGGYLAEAPLNGEVGMWVELGRGDQSVLAPLAPGLITELPIQSWRWLKVGQSGLALRQHPRLNATLAGDTIRLLPDIHIGLAVALDDGLIVPVIRHADQKSLADLARERVRLAERARANQLTTAEVTAGTFTVTNLGAYDIDAFTPIVNPPEAAILGVGRIVDKVVIYRGKIGQRSMMGLSLSFDHRLVDGAPAAAFLQNVKQLLEAPASLE